MKHKFTFFLLLCLSANGLSAQDEPADEPRAKRELDRFDDKLLFEITHDFWLDLPKDAEVRIPSVGFKAYFFSDYTFGQESNLSFAWGFGVSADNVNTNAQWVQLEFPDGSVSDQTLTPVSDDYEYDKNKFVTTYLELPVELRFITKGRSPFKLAAGFRLGYLLSDHAKIIDTEGKRKLYDYDGVATWRYGVSGRIGVGKIQLTGFYSLVPLIEEGKGTQVIPVSVGIALTPIR